MTNEVSEDTRVRRGVISLVAILIGIGAALGATGYVDVPIWSTVLAVVVLAWVHVGGLRDPKGPVATPLCAILLSTAVVSMWIMNIIAFVVGFKLLG